MLEDRKSKGETTESVVVSKDASTLVTKKKMSFKEKREFEILEKEMPELETEKSLQRKWEQEICLSMNCKKW